MGEHAVFIWSAYGLAFVVLGGLVLATWRRLDRQAKLLRDLNALQANRADKDG